MFVNIRTLIKLSIVANGARTVCKVKLSVKIKPIIANTRAKDKYVKVGMINTYFSWLGALIIVYRTRVCNHRCHYFNEGGGFLNYTAVVMCSVAL